MSVVTTASPNAFSCLRVSISDAHKCMAASSPTKITDDCTFSQKGWDDIYGGIHIDPACDIEGTKGRACCVAINPKRGAPAIQERTK